LRASAETLDPLVRRCGIDAQELRPDVLLFAAQSYFALVARLLAGHALALCRHQPSPLEAIAGCANRGEARQLVRVLHTGAVSAALDGRHGSGHARGVDRAESVGCLRQANPSCDGAAQGPFVWHLAAWSAPIAELVQRLSGALLTLTPRDPVENPWAEGDLLGPLSRELLPRRLRHTLGQYFTPDWLAEHVLDQVGFEGWPDQRVLDPTCGSGVFLLAVLRRIRGWWREHGGKPAARRSGACDVPAGPAELCAQVLGKVVGLELDPAAVVAARANYLMAVADWLPKGAEAAMPVILGDVFSAAAGQRAVWAGQAVRRGQTGFGTRAAPDAELSAEKFDLVVGNPPWIAWDNLAPEWRRATEPQWRSYGLFTLSGTESRHGGAKKDLAMLVLYVCADRYLRDRGRLGMVIPQTVFQTHGAGEGFRRLRLGAEGEPLKVLRVDDLARVRPFAGATNLPATIALEKGMPTHYPVRYVRWLPAEEQPAAGHAVGQDTPTRAAMWLRKPIRLEECLAAPVDPERPGSPWLVCRSGAPGPDGPLRSLGPSDYQAYLGANTGGANGVYWFELIEATGRGTLRVRNLAACGRAKLAAEVYELEADLLFPLLRWGDVAVFRARPSAWILLAQDPATRTGIDEQRLRSRWPRTYAYLCAHEGLLRRRAAWRRYQRGRPFYSMYNVGPYTLAPYKVVWRRMDRRLRAAVVEPLDHTLAGSRPVVPQETCVLIPCETPEEAHYLCALLNSRPVGRLAAGCSVSGGKSFGTPAILGVLGLRRFDPACATHVELAALGRTAHTRAGDPESLQEIMRRIDRAGARLLEARP